MIVYLGQHIEIFIKKGKKYMCLELLPIRIRQMGTGTVVRTSYVQIWRQ